MNRELKTLEVAIMSETARHIRSSLRHELTTITAMGRRCPSGRWKTSCSGRR